MKPAPKFCGQCGASLEAGARFCGECGTPIDDFQEHKQKSTSENRTPNTPPHTAKSPNNTASPFGQSCKKALAWILSLPVWVRIGILFVVIFAQLTGGFFDIISLLVFLGVLFIAFFIGKIVMGAFAEKDD